MPEIGRRGFLKGLAALTGSTLAGKYVVESPSVVRPTDLLVPNSGLILPGAQQIVMARDISAHVAGLEMIPREWSIDMQRSIQEIYTDTYWREYDEGGPVRGTMQLTGDLVGPVEDWAGWARMAQGKAVRIYVEVVE